MSPYLAVHHPLDPTCPPFDFWGWRIQRRFVVDRLRALARTLPAPQAATFTLAARQIEREHWDAAGVEKLRQALHALDATATFHTLKDLLLIVSRLTTSRELPVQMHWTLPALLPDWDETPFRRPMFVGRANGVALQAHLVPSTQLVPEYTLIWTHPDGQDESPLNLQDARLGSHLSFAPAIWDWCFARRCTLLALQGLLPWPSADAPPLLLPAGLALTTAS